MLDHVGLRVSNYEESKRFFREALAPLRYELVMEFGDDVAGFGVPGRPEFWISRGGPSAAVHVAFSCPDRATVDAFYESAIAAGGRDNGAPGVRAEYHPTYYGAFVIDPDGNNIEAVCHQPE